MGGMMPKIDQPVVGASSRTWMVRSETWKSPSTKAINDGHGIDGLQTAPRRSALKDVDGVGSVTLEPQATTVTAANERTNFALCFMAHLQKAGFGPSSEGEHEACPAGSRPKRPRRYFGVRLQNSATVALPAQRR